MILKIDFRAADRQFTLEALHIPDAAAPDLEIIADILACASPEELVINGRKIITR